MTEQASNDAFYLPDLGEGLSEAEVVAWHVAEGDRVVPDQPLVSVETDKAIVDIPAPHGGRIKTLNAEVGERLPVGGLLFRFEVSDAAPSETAETGSVVGELPSVPKPVAPPAAQDVIHASPKARRRAQELGVDIGSVEPTGPGGSIGVGDVELAATVAIGRPLSGVRRAMARRMADAHARVARATVTGEADITGWDADDALMRRLIRSVGVACLAKPIVNASFDDRTMVVTEHSEVNLGVAMETADGLFVPVLKDINRAEHQEIWTELQRLKSAVLERRIKPDELRGQTITLSNFGAVGGIHGEMIVVPPQLAIVGAGRAFQRMQERSIRRVLPVSISFDHRVITGAEACAFLVALTNDLERNC